MALGLATLTNRPAIGIASGLRLALVAACAAATVGAAAGAVYVCSGPTDFTQRGGPADGLQIINADNQLLFSLHADLARALDAAGCSPTASGVQWLKAAAHTSVPELNQQVVNGFAQARERSAEPDSTAAGICSFITPGSFRQRQLDDLKQAGLACPNES